MALAEEIQRFGIACWLSLTLPTITTPASRNHGG